MNILIVAERFWPEVGAAPTRLKNMAQGLKEQGHHVEVLTSLPNYPKGRIYDGYRHKIAKHETHNGVEVFRFWVYATISKSPIARILGMFSFAFFIWGFIFRIRRICKYNLVIIQTPTLVSAASAMVLFKKVFRKRCVLNVSDIWPTTAVDMGAMREGSASYRFMAALERFLYRNSHAIIGQSNEILNHVAGFAEKPEKRFLYRNLHVEQNISMPCQRRGRLKIVFCGMLGVAQDVAGLIQHVPFREMNVEFHVLGGGKQLEEIKDYIAEHPDCNVFAHGFVPKEQIPQWMENYDVAIIPLATRIRGAVPSKLYDTLPYGLPILFCGGGEGAEFVASHEVGLTCQPGDYEAIRQCIETLRDMPEDAFRRMSANSIKVAKTELNFQLQMKACGEFLETL